jgi:hypothetical protein
VEWLVEPVTVVLVVVTVVESVVVEHSSKIVSTEQEVLELSKMGYSCSFLWNGKWLMRN